MKPRHHLRCLGYPALFAPTGELIRIRTKKHLALLVYLAVESRRPHRRDDLAAFLWPKAKPAEARHSLSTALSLFRALLGREAVEAGREKVSFNAGGLTLDIDQLLSQDRTTEEWATSLALAEFLEGFDIADAPDFAHWMDYQQARLLPLIKGALIAKIDHFRKAGDFQSIEALANQVLTLDDLCEEAIRAKMEARALAGDRISALRLYQEWNNKLAHELNAQPSDTLQRMAARLRRASQWQANTKIAVLSSTRNEMQRVFVGRTTEYRAAYNAWELTQRGTATHLLISGESGLGKTALASRLADTVSLSGATVAQVQCYEIEHDIPYSALSHLIEQLLKQPGSVATSPQALAELSYIAPDIRRQFPELPTRIIAHGETARLQLTDAVFELLAALADEGPVLVVIDDIHFADEASIAVLHLVIRCSRNKPIMTISTTTRNEDVAGSR